MAGRPQSPASDPFARQRGHARRAEWLITLAVVVAATNCGGGGGSSSGPNPPPSPGTSISVSPGSLTLNVGGVGTLTATVINASGAPVPNAAVSWQSRNAAIAAVTNGSVIGVSIGQTTVVASSGGKSDSALVTVLDNLTLTIVPAAGTVNVGNTFPFSVVARNSAGQTVATPAVSWASSNPTIATISSAGVATGVAKGVVMISAAAVGATAVPATLTVTDSVAACDGIASVPVFYGQLDYAYAVSGTSEGGFNISSQYNATLKATLDSVLINPFNVIWTGRLEGSASLRETKTDPVSGAVQKLDGQGPILPVGMGLFVPKMNLIVDLQSCTAKITVNPAISQTLTEPDGRTSNSVTLAAQLQIAHGAVGIWRQLGISNFDASAEGRSVAWAGMNPDKTAFSPLGFAVELMLPTGPVGAATVNYTLTNVKPSGF